MSRFKAAGIHLLLSALIVAIVLSLMWFVWYPQGFFKLLGGSGLVLLIAAVDVTLGPLLTLVVFDTKKPSLKMDLAIIGVIQLAALIYGTQVMFNARPVFNVLEQDVFKVTLASDFEDDVELKLAKQEKWRHRSITGPQLVAATAPTSKADKAQMVMAAAAGLDWNHFPKLFVEYDSQRQVALNNAKPLSALKAQVMQQQATAQAESLQMLQAFLDKTARPISDFVYLPIVYNYTAMTAVLDAKNADFIEIIAIDP